MFSLVWLFIIPRTIVCQVPLSKELSRPKYWRRLTFLIQGDLSDPGIVPASFASPASLALVGTSFIIWVTGEAQNYWLRHLNSNYSVPQFTHKFVTEIIKINALLFKNKEWKLPMNIHILELHFILSILWFISFDINMLCL